MQDTTKIIEEMANEINEMDEPNAHYYDKRLRQHEAFADCFTIARHLYDKGYRKQSEGEWIRHKENCLYNKCSICSYEHCREDNYCPNCGAKMKGGAE